MLKPILFNTEMVRAILDGRKTVTRRIIKWSDVNLALNSAGRKDYPDVLDEVFIENLCDCRYAVGDILYVRETWGIAADLPGISEEATVYAADFTDKELAHLKDRHFRWRPSIHMPKELARLFLKVKLVRAERLGRMEIEDYIKEGVKPRPLKRDGCRCQWETEECHLHPCTNRDAYEVLEYALPFDELWDATWEVHTFEEAKQVRRNFIRVLTYHYPDAVIHLVMGRGKATKRIHFHMVSNGISLDFIKKKWKYGKIAEHSYLRKHNWYEDEPGIWVDHGQDYTGLATYMWEHWTEEVGGHRWFQTKNVRQPDAEKPTKVRKTGGYSEKCPPRAPKGYKLVETKATKYGYLYFKYVVIPPEQERKKTKKKTGQGTG